VLSGSEIRRRVKSGAIFRDGVPLASFLGHPGAREAAPEISEAPAGLEALVERLSDLPFSSKTFRHVAIVRAMLALVRPILALARERREVDHATGFHATETWAVCPCDMCLAALRTLCVHGLAADDPLELQMQYHVAGVAMDPAFAVEVMRKATALDDRTETRERVAGELLGWALRERDPVRASIGTRVFFRLDPRATDPGIRRLARAQLDPEVEERFTAVAGQTVAPGFAAPPGLPVTAGDRRDLLANDHGLLIASDRLKEALAGKVPDLEFAPMVTREGKKERLWLAFSRAPHAALAQRRRGELVVLDPNLVAGAPVLFRLEPPDLDCYLIDKAYIGALLDAGIRTGIHAHAAPFGRALDRG
jgi:hypothetical protein